MLMLAVLFLAGMNAGYAENPTAKENGNILRMDEFLGAWELVTADSTGRKNTEPGIRMLIENDRLIMYSSSRHSFLPLIVRKNGCYVRLGTQYVPVVFTYSEKNLIVVLNKKKSTYVRLDKTPDSLIVKPMVFGKQKELKPERIASVQKELARRRQKDQEVRTVREKASQMRTVDRDNTEYLKKLVKEIGWIDCQRFGKKTSNAAFLIVQHSGDLPLMMAALPEIEKDVNAGRIDGQPYTLLYDRLQLFLGYRQKYGTQIGSNADGAPVVFPLIDRSRVEEFRKQLGIFPLKRYLQFFEERAGKKAVFMSDAPE